MRLKSKLQAIKSYYSLLGGTIRLYLLIRVSQVRDLHGLLAVFSSPANILLTLPSPISVDFSISSLSSVRSWFSTIGARFFTVLSQRNHDLERVFARSGHKDRCHSNDKANLCQRYGGLTQYGILVVTY